MTAYQRVAAALFRELHGRDLLEWIEEQREDGRSWQHIAAQLEELTDGAVSVTRQSLLNWTSRQEAA